MKKLLDIMSALRNPQNGCPWDIKQTLKSIIPYTLEEAYEVADAIEQGDMCALKAELGDLLFQVVFYAQIAKEQSAFEFNDVLDAISEKLISRHPHVFAGEQYENAASLNEAWEQAKALERERASVIKPATVLEGVAVALPALKRAQKLQKRAARVGFDWPAVAPVLEKIEEEIQELREAMQQQNQAAMFEEMGDVLFSCVNLSRHLGVDSEEALRASNKKFERRFLFIEKALQARHQAFADQSLDQLEALWQEAKQVKK
jgi:ATP diphosphatase